MPYRRIEPDAATCQPQIFDDQPETSVSLPQLQSELALQVILSSFVLLNRSDICGSKHVVQLLKDSDLNGVYNLIASGHIAVVMEENMPTLYDWWESSKGRIPHRASIDENYVRGVSAQLEQYNAFRLSGDYYKFR